MKRKKIYPFFFLALLFALFATSSIPYLKFLPFAPFLVIVCTSQGLLRSLWIAALCGLIMDLMGSDLPFGIHALNYTLTTLLIYRYRRSFVEKPIGLSSFTFFFSLFSTGIQLGSLFLFGKFIPLTLKGLVSDLLIMPLVDALYAFLWFSTPIFLYNFIKRQWFRFLFFRKETKRKIKEEVKS